MEKFWEVLTFSKIPCSVANRTGIHGLYRPHGKKKAVRSVRDTKLIFEKQHENEA